MREKEGLKTKKWVTIREIEYPSSRTLYETLRIYFPGNRKPRVIILNWLIPLGVLNPWHSQDALKVPRQVAIMVQKASGKDTDSCRCMGWGAIRTHGINYHNCRRTQILANEIQVDLNMCATDSHLSTTNTNIHEHIHIGLIYIVLSRKCHWGCWKYDKENVSILTHLSELIKLFSNKWRKLEYHFLSLYSLHIYLLRKNLDHQIAPKPIFSFSYQY